MGMTLIEIDEYKQELKPHVEIANDLLRRSCKYLGRRYEEGPETPDLSNARWLLGWEEKRALSCFAHCIPLKTMGPNDDRLWGIRVIWVPERNFSLIVEDAENPQERPVHLDAWRIE